VSVAGMVSHACTSASIVSSRSVLEISHGFRHQWDDVKRSRRRQKTGGSAVVDRQTDSSRGSCRTNHCDWARPGMERPQCVPRHCEPPH
jgi:hypothetical protein